MERQYLANRDRNLLNSDIERRAKAARSLIKYEGYCDDADLLLSYVVWPNEMPKVREEVKNDSPAPLEIPYTDVYADCG